MNALDTVDSKVTGGVLAAQVRRAAEVSPGDLAEAERLAGLVAVQLRSAGPSRTAGLHRLSSLEVGRLIED